MESALKKIIVVDDDITNLNVARNTLAEAYDVFTVPSGAKLFQLLKRVVPDLILLDVEMPEMNGYDVIRALKSTPGHSQIPIIFLTSRIDPKSELQGFDLGAIDYITKPFSPPLLLKRIEVHLYVEAQKKELQISNINLAGMVEAKRRTVFELQNAILKTVAELVECRDDVTGGHIERTQNYLDLFMNILLKHNVYIEDISSWDISLFVMSSQLHDVGKISIKDSILLKPGKLTPEEFEEMKRHTILGADIIKNIEKSTKENTFLRHAKILAGSHHEKWDGSGYPYGLKGVDIPLQGRLMAIVDVYDALTNSRSYKKAFTHEDSVEIIKNGLGQHFDPVLGGLFIKYEKEFQNKSPVKRYFDFGYVNPAEADNSFRATVLKTVTNIVDRRSGMEDGHAERIKRYLEIFIDDLKNYERYRDEVTSWDVDVFFLAAQLYDVGKIAVNDHILDKAAKLTAPEYEKVKTHAGFGASVVNRIGEDVNEGSLLDHAKALVGSHHEKWDGTGYPSGLKGEDIPLEGRIMAIIDMYDALRHDRPHRGAMSHAEALEIIEGYSGSYFDPDLVDVFIEHEQELLKRGGSARDYSGKADDSLDSA